MEELRKINIKIGELTERIRKISSEIFEKDIFPF